MTNISDENAYKLFAVLEKIGRGNSFTSLTGLFDLKTRETDRDGATLVNYSISNKTMEIEYEGKSETFSISKVVEILDDNLNTLYHWPHDDSL